MKLIAQIKLQPTPEQHTVLLRTLETANAACNYVSDEAWQSNTFGQFALHKLCYTDVRRQFGLGAEATVCVFAKVADAYKRDRRTRRAFTPRLAFPFNHRLVSYKLDKRVVSIWTMAGRQKIPFVCAEHHAKLLEGLRGECDLVYRHGELYLHQSCDVDELPAEDLSGFLGIDLAVG